MQLPYTDGGGILEQSRSSLAFLFGIFSAQEVPQLQPVTVCLCTSPDSEFGSCRALLGTKYTQKHATPISRAAFILCSFDYSS